MTATVLVVEDEVKIRELVRRYLEHEDLSVLTTGSGAEALTMLETQQVDMIVLDLNLPDVSGETIAAEVRSRSALPILMLTAKSSEADRIRGLELGADDYLTKPFSPQELTLRVAAVLRRLQAPAIASGSSLTSGPLTIDRSAHRVLLDGAEVPLTATEYRLLITLVERQGRVQTRPQLLEAVWDAQPDIQTRTVDMHVQRLRAKLGETGHLIETVRGFGYRFRSAERGSAVR
jgi:two-component system phosphate regulon response regulator PhoB